jgi:hypothetical protein
MPIGIRARIVAEALNSGAARDLFAVVEGDAIISMSGPLSISVSARQGKPRHRERPIGSLDGAARGLRIIRKSNVSERSASVRIG